MKAKSQPVWDWTAATLLVFAMFTASIRLDTTNWTPDLGYVESLAVLGTILGLALGVSRFQRRGVFWLASLYSLVMLPMNLSRIITGEQESLAQLLSLWGRLSVSGSLLMSGKAITDHLFFVTIMAVLFWVTGMYSGYQLMRGRAILWVLLPSTLPILVIQYYDGYVPDHIWGVGLYFFLALMLVGRINLLNSRERWEEQRIAAGSEPEFDLGKNIAVTAAVIVLAAWLVPTPAVILPEAASAWQQFNQPFDSARARLNDVLAALNAHRENTAPGELYGDVMGLGRTAGSGGTELFSVQAPPNGLPRLYWRMRVYDTYENGSWKMLRSQNTLFDPEKGNFPTVDILPASLADFTFSWHSSTSAILATPFQPVWSSRKGSVQLLFDPGGENDPISWNVNPGVQNGDQYLVRALLSDPTQEELRASGSTYPDWVSAHYLQVPVDIAPTYTRLAQQITNGLTSNYDRAESVTAYLRQNITYSQTLPNIPPGVEPLNWFLFNFKSGFCDYYASAEVMLLRTLGIPARMAVGFAQGKAGANFTFSVRGVDAHAWPEVYFPGIGWVQFEPTVNQAALIRPNDVVQNPAEHPHNPSNGLDTHPIDNLDKPDTSSASKIAFLGIGWQQWLWIIICIIIIILVGVLGWRLERQQSFGQRIPQGMMAVFRFYNIKTPAWAGRWVQWSEASDTERAFHSVNQSLQWLRRPQPGYATPAERAAALKAILPEASEDIDLLGSALEKTLFTPHPVDSASAARAARAGWRLRLFTLRKIMQRWLHGA